MVSFCIKTTKHLDIRRDVKKFSPVGCCIVLCTYPVIPSVVHVCIYCYEPGVTRK